MDGGEDDDRAACGVEGGGQLARDRAETGGQRLGVLTGGAVCYAVVSSNTVVSIE